MAKKILIIESDIFFENIILGKLKDNTYDVYLTRDELQAIKKMKELLPDLVLLDAVSTTIHGYEILEEKSKDQKISEIPTIVISNSNDPSEIDRLLSLGVKDYMVKAQFNPLELLKKIKLQLDDYQNNRQKMAEKKSENMDLSIKGKKIMWVEDDIFLSEIIAKKLASQGCALLHEIDGEAALKTAEYEKPDIILLDILLSGIDGFEILKRLKANNATKHIPIVMLSNLGQKADIDKAMSLGAERFLIKAIVTLDEIIDEIKNILIS